MKEDDEKMKIEKELNTEKDFTQQKKLYDEFSNFLIKHSVYETIPENMKVKRYLKKK